MPSWVWGLVIYVVTVGAAWIFFESVRDLADRLSDRAASPYRSRRVKIVDNAGELLVDVSPPPSEATRSTETVHVASSTETTASEVVQIVQAFTREHAEQDRPRSFWARHSTVILTGLFALAGAIFVPVWSSMHGTGPDCVDYGRMLGELKTAHPDADSAVLFGDGGLSFGDVESECGDPDQFFDGL